jgi:hypothetical protein
MRKKIICDSFSVPELFLNNKIYNLGGNLYNMPDYSRLYFDQLKSKVNQIKSDFEDEKDSISFLRLCSSLICNVELTEVDDILTEGYDDLGADAISFNVNDDDKEFEIDILQTKYNKTDCEANNFGCEIGEDVVNKFKNIFDYIFGASSDEQFVNEDIKEKKEEYSDLAEKGYILNKVNFHVGHLGSKISNRSMEVWSRWLQGNHFKDNITLTNWGLLSLYKKFDESRTVTLTENINFYGKFFEFSSPDVKGLISTIEGKKLVELFEAHGNKLFQKNIRYSLGENLINTKIIESASSTQDRDKFWFLNNGITIVCKRYDKINANSENIALKLTDFQIVNGAQTTSCLKKALEKIGNIDQVKILVKVFQAEDKLAELITDSTNTQNPVSKRDLRSNDEIQKLLGEDISGRGYFYQRKNNQFIQETDTNKIIDNYDFAQRYYAFFKEKPAEARNKKAELFDKEEVYKSIFNSNLNGKAVIFVHNSFLNLLKGLRNLKKKVNKREIALDQEIMDISQRAKYHLYYGFRLLFEKEGKRVDTEVFQSNDQTLEYFKDINKIAKLLKIINESINELLDSSRNKVKVFQKTELAEKIKLKIQQHPPI